MPKTTDKALAKLRPAEHFCQLGVDAAWPPHTTATTSDTPHR